MEWLICLNTTFVKSAVLQFQCCVSCWLLGLSCCTSCHYYCCRCVILAALCMCVGNSGGDWEGQIPSLPLLLHINTQRLNVVLVHFVSTLNHCIYRHLHLDQQRVFNMPDARWSSQRKQQQRPFTIKSETAQICHKTSSRTFGCTWSSSGLWLGSNSWPYDDDHQRKNWMLSLCARCLVCLVSQVCKLKHICPWFSFFLRKCITTNHIRWFTLFKGLRMVLCWWSLGATQDFPYSGLQVVAVSHYTGQQALCYWDSFACTLIDFTC